MKYSSAIPEFVGDSNEISSYRCWIHGNTRKVATQEQAYVDAKAVCELFTAPQKPVVLPGKKALNPNDPSPIWCASKEWNSAIDACRAAIEAAGDIVKDGE